VPIRLKRAYEPATDADGRRYLVDRLWPRGVTKEALRLTAWLREIAPTDELRRDYCHDPALFGEFRRRYREELRARAATLAELRRESRDGTVTLVLAAKDVERSNAAVLAELLDEEGAEGTSKGRRGAAGGRPNDRRRGRGRSTPRAPPPGASTAAGPRTGPRASRTR
jgi:uncharacterized protein YeaO (DUF488 family)